MKLTQEEQAILDSVARGEWRSVAETDAELERYRDAAKATLRKDKRVNIRISERDLACLQKRAIEEGLPYQTLISSVLHKFVNGRLREPT